MQDTWRETISSTPEDSGDVQPKPPSLFTDFRVFVFFMVIKFHGRY